MASDLTPSQRRGFRLRLAVGTSLISKVGTIVLQIAAIPLAMRAMGFELYGVYATLSTAIAFLSLAGIGVGPGLTRAIAKAHADDDKDTERSYGFTAIVILLVVGTVAASSVYSILSLAPATTLFGKEFAEFQGVIRSCAPVVATLVFMELLLSLVDRMCAGYQEMHLINIWGAAGNFAGGILLITCIHRWPTVPFLMIAVLGMQQLGRLGNGLSMLLVRRRYLLTGRKVFSSAKAKELIQDGVAFTAAQSIAPLLHREGGKLIASHVGGPAAAGVYAVLNQMSTMLGGIIAMVTAPLWPALMDAAHRRDFSWFEVARRRLRIAVLGYTGLAAIALIAAGGWLIDLWLGGAVPISQGVLVAFAAYTVVMAWNHANYICLAGLGMITAPALIAVLEAVGALLVGWVGIHHFDMPGLLWGMTLVVCLVSAWLFPMLLSSRLQQCRQGGEPQPATLVPHA